MYLQIQTPTQSKTKCKVCVTVFVTCVLHVCHFFIVCVTCVLLFVLNYILQCVACVLGVCFSVWYMCVKCISHLSECALCVGYI